MSENIQLLKYLIHTNQDLINKTALFDCHCIGLNSFIINEHPKIRLFITEPHCVLFSKYEADNPIIPIHPHKYDDIFTQIEGKLIHHIYRKGNKYDFNKYGYMRLSDTETGIIHLGKEKLDYVGAFDDVTVLQGSVLHSASTKGKRCSWMITETFINPLFEQVAYHRNLTKREELYTPMESPLEYLTQYLSPL